jgi:pimeloyl-ACP methyl ester carboxylesterase
VRGELPALGGIDGALGWFAQRTGLHGVERRVEAGVLAGARDDRDHTDGRHQRRAVHHLSDLADEHVRDVRLRDRRERRALRPAAAPTGAPRRPRAGARLVTLRGCGHVPTYDDPEQVAWVLLEGGRG